MHAKNEDISWLKVNRRKRTSYTKTKKRNIQKLPQITSCVVVVYAWVSCRHGVGSFFFVLQIVTCMYFYYESRWPLANSFQKKKKKEKITTFRIKYVFQFSWVQEKVDISRNKIYYFLSVTYYTQPTLQASTISATQTQCNKPLVTS